MWWYFSCHKSIQIVSYSFEKFKLVGLWKEFAGFQSFSDDWYNPANTLCFSWIFTYKAKDSCYMGEKKFSKVSVVYLSVIEFFQLIVGMFSFSFWLFYFLRLFCFVFFFFFNSENIEKFQKDKNILFWVLFYFSWGLHELWYLSLDLEHAWHCGETWIVCVI